MSLYLLIFDCDGTLIDSRKSIVEVATMVIEQFQLPMPDDARILETVGLSLPQAIAHLFPHEPESLILEMSDAYKGAFMQMRAEERIVDPLYDGASSLLQDLYGYDHVFLGIATGKARRGVNAEFERLDIDIRKFSTIQTADVAASKPHPDMIDRAMRETGIDRDNTFMIGDTSYDMQMAKSAGVHPIGVNWGYHKQSELQQAGARDIVQNYGELSELIDTLLDLKSG